MTPPDEPLSPAAKKTTRAALLMLALFFAAFPAALYSGYVLYRGEEAIPTMQALPAGCDEVVFVQGTDRIVELANLQGQLGLTWAQLANPASPRQQRIWVDVAVEGPDAIALCRIASTWVGVATIQQSSDELTQGAAWVQHFCAAQTWTASGSDTVGRTATGQNVAAVHATGQLVQVAWRDSRAAADLSFDAALVLTRMRQRAEAKSMQADADVRDAFERVGFGSLLWFRRDLQAVAIAPVPDATRPSLALVGTGAQWAATSVRMDRAAARIVVHEHWFGGQRLASWLKHQFDVAEPLDAAPLLARLGSPPRWGMLRTPTTGLTAIGALDPQAVELAAALPSTSIATDRLLTEWLTGQFLWVEPQLGKGRCFLAELQPAHRDATQLPAAWPAPKEPQMTRRLVAGFLAMGPAPTVDGVAQQLQSQVRHQPVELTKDQQRLAEQTQGWTLRDQPPGQTQFEWTWLDTGLIVERTYRWP